MDELMKKNGITALEFRAGLISVPRLMSKLAVIFLATLLHVKSCNLIKSCLKKIFFLLETETCFCFSFMLQKAQRADVGRRVSFSVPKWSAAIIGLDVF